MDTKRALPVHKRAWLVFSVALFCLSWLLWIPVQSKPLVYFWELWPMMFTSSALQAEFWFWLLGSIVVFLAGAVFLGWILQFLWGLLISILKRDHES